MKKSVGTTLVLVVAVLFIAGASIYLSLSDSPIPSEKLDYCELAEDCIPVNCECGCTGCGQGGIDYEEIINKKYEKRWYSQKGCSKDFWAEKNQICPSACCPVGEIDCKENKCVYVEFEGEY